MAVAAFYNLPKELREEIWLLALLPEPGVYKFDPDWFIPLENEDGWEDDRWMIPKRRYPTAMHLCQESRRFAFYIKEREQEQEQNGIMPYFCLGKNARPFNTTTDSFWFISESLVGHPWVRNLNSVVGRRIHTIENLALSPQCISHCIPGSGLVSEWDLFKCHRLAFFVSLQRINIIFAESYAEEDNNESMNSSFKDQSDITELRLKKWREGSSKETAEEVEKFLQDVKADILPVFEDVCARKLENNIDEILYLLPEDAPDWHDGSRVTFHASQVIKFRTF
jgi:hypothetical protein